MARVKRQKDHEEKGTRFAGVRGGAEKGNDAAVESASAEASTATTVGSAAAKLDADAFKHADVYGGGKRGGQW